jgi:quercetin dioxygenase-like cupin family protein
MKNFSRKKILSLLAAALTLAGMAADAAAHDASASFETLLKTSSSWAGHAYEHYPAGKPELTVLKVNVPPRTELSWHTHPMISVVYLVSGKLNLKIKETGQSISFNPGDVFADTVDILHRGYTDDSAVEMIVFFAGTPGMPLREAPGAPVP